MCGPISLGTVGVVRALMTHLGLPMAEALALVDRCVFDGQRVEIATPSRSGAEALLEALSRTLASARIDVSLTP